jgi:hypothetical protein
MFSALEGGNDFSVLPDVGEPADKDSASRPPPRGNAPLAGGKVNLPRSPSSGVDHFAQAEPVQAINAEQAARSVDFSKLPRFVSR